MRDALLIQYAISHRELVEIFDYDRKSVAQKFMGNDSFGVREQTFARM